jgi:hypothetical protein
VQDAFAPQRADIPDEVIWEGIPRTYFDEESDAQLYTLEVGSAACAAAPPMPLTSCDGVGGAHSTCRAR